MHILKATRHAENVVICVSAFNIQITTAIRIPRQSNERVVLTHGDVQMKWGTKSCRVQHARVQGCNTCIMKQQSTERKHGFQCIRSLSHACTHAHDYEWLTSFGTHVCKHTCSRTASRLLSVEVGILCK
jgi:hypothetical protein